MTEEPTEPETNHTPVRDTGGKATAEQGIVMLDGPAGVAVAMTPDAATETAQSLSSAAELVRTQTPDSPQDA